MKPTVPPEPPRWQRFNDTTGAISWNRRSANLHPDRCVCQELERGQNAGTPHKHYDEPPHACARCSECDAYRPAVAAVPPEPAPPTPPRPQDGKQCGACSRGDHADCSGWCFCPNGPCDETPAAAPPTVAPAREVAHKQAQAPSLRFPCRGGEVDHDGLTYAHSATCDRWTDVIAECDRASRSPGPAPETWDEFMVADGVCRLGVFCVTHEFIHGGEAEHLRSEIERVIGDGDGKVRKSEIRRVLDEVDARDSVAYLEAKAKERAVDEARSPSALRGEGPSPGPGFRQQLFSVLHRCRHEEITYDVAIDLISALRVQEGRLRPGSDEGAAGKVHGAPLSGLDAATVPCEQHMSAVGEPCMAATDGTQRMFCLPRIARALATPPGQAKP